MNEFGEIFGGLENDPEYLKIHAAHDFTFSVEKQMEALGISKAELAEKLGTSRAHVTQMLRGNGNFTLESMVKVAVALGTKLHIKICDDDSQETQNWFNALQRVDVFGAAATYCPDNYEEITLAGRRKANANPTAA